MCDGRVGEDVMIVDAGVGGDGGARRRRGELELMCDCVDVGGEEGEVVGKCGKGDGGVLGE